MSIKKRGSFFKQTFFFLTPTPTVLTKDKEGDENQNVSQPLTVSQSL